MLEVIAMLHTSGPTQISRDNGGFIANLNFPGWLVPLPRDHGHGALAMIAESLMVPGRIIEMHEHQNDEIISWVPDGVMRHVCASATGATRTSALASARIEPRCADAAPRTACVRRNR